MSILNDILLDAGILPGDLATISRLLDDYEIEWIRENLPVIEVDEIPLEYIKLLAD